MTHIDPLPNPASLVAALNVHIRGPWPMLVPVFCAVCSAQVGRIEASDRGALCVAWVPKPELQGAEDHVELVDLAPGGFIWECAKDGDELVKQADLRSYVGRAKRGEKVRVNINRSR